MKNINYLLIISSFFLLMGLSKNTIAQGNLQFNQVVYTNLPSGGNVPISVPAGKVWKIESVGCGTTVSGTVVYLRNSASQNVAVLFLNGNPHAYQSVTPYWLPASFIGSFQQSGNAANCSISVIEFNVLP